MALSDPREVADHFVLVPKVLICPVHDVDACLEEVGMYALGPQVLIQNSLADLLECSVADYREQICCWLHDSAPELPMIVKWIVIRGMNLQEYLDLLSTGTSVDGLKLWVASMAMNIPISIIMEDSIWSTDWARVNLEGKCYILANYWFCSLCNGQRSWDCWRGACCSSPSPITEPFVKHVGHPLMSILEYPDLLDSEKEDTDLDTLLVEEATPIVPMVSSG